MIRCFGHLDHLRQIIQSRILIRLTAKTEAVLWINKTLQNNQERMELYVVLKHFSKHFNGDVMWSDE
jgi:hypothetical protein